MICCSGDVLKISASLCNAHTLGLEISKGEARDGLRMAVMRSNTAFGRSVY